MNIFLNHFISYEYNIGRSKQLFPLYRNLFIYHCSCVSMKDVRYYAVSGVFSSCHFMCETCTSFRRDAVEGRTCVSIQTAEHSSLSQVPQTHTKDALNIGLLCKRVLYHLRQFGDHAAETLDVRVVPRVHRAQVGAKSAEIFLGLMKVFLERKEHERENIKIHQMNSCEPGGFSLELPRASLLLVLRQHICEGLFCIVKNPILCLSSRGKQLRSIQMEVLSGEKTMTLEQNVNLKIITKTRSLK